MQHVSVEGGEWVDDSTSATTVRLAVDGLFLSRATAWESRGFPFVGAWVGYFSVSTHAPNLLLHLPMASVYWP